MKVRFELFAGLSLLAHAAVFVGVAARREAPPSASSTGTTPGASAAIGGDTFEVPEVEDVASQVPSEEAASEEAASIGNRRTSCDQRGACHRKAFAERASFASLSRAASRS